MKKLLLLIALIGGNICAGANQQSLFADFTAYKYTSLDPDKISLAASIIPVQHKLFFKLLAQLDGEGKLTHENILSLINKRYNVSDRTITSIKDCHIGEILKSQKNELTDKVVKLKIEDPTINDNIMMSCAGALLTSGCVVGSPPGELNRFIGASVAFTLIALYQTYKYHRYIRSKERQMDTIDMLIQKIELIEQEESA